MNFLKVFEERISSLLSTNPADASPLPFKKLAKQALKELQNETYVIDGKNTAPALFTILINPADDKAMSVVAEDVAHETALFLEAAGKRKHYAFVGEPLVRFMTDPALKPGKFSVFAENIDAPTLEKLRAEEQGFLAERAADAPKAQAKGERPAKSRPEARRARTSAPAAAASEDAVAPHYGDEFDAIGQNVASLAENPPARGKSVPLVAGRRTATRRAPSAEAPEAPRNTTPAAAPATGDAGIPPQHAAMLIDRQTGQTFSCTQPECIIGRERTSGGIVLRDPNISRKHARLLFNGRYWAVEDLGSTNGTLLNNVDVEKKRLSTGDVLTFGLTNLEFVEG